jgi:hypothetical protein
MERRLDSLDSQLRRLHDAINEHLNIISRRLDNLDHISHLSSDLNQRLDRIISIFTPPSPVSPIWSQPQEGKIRQPLDTAFSMGRPLYRDRVNRELEPLFMTAEAQQPSARRISRIK